jgi:hypothetical protein
MRQFRCWHESAELGGAASRRAAMHIEITWGGSRGEALDTRAGRHGDHVLLKPLIIPDPRIAPARQHVHEAVFDDDLQPDIGIGLQERRYDRRQNESSDAGRHSDRTVNRMGYGAMQLAGPGVFGPPKDRDTALAVLREAVASGVNHIDTSDFYGPHVTNHLIREALHPYPDDLVIVTKVGAVRGDDASWIPARTPADLISGVHDNLRNLGLDALDVVNLRVGGIHGPSEGSIEEQFTTLAELQRQGLIRHLGLSNVTSAQIEQGRRGRVRAEPLQSRPPRRRHAD